MPISFRFSLSLTIISHLSLIHLHPSLSIHVRLTSVLLCSSICFCSSSLSMTMTPWPCTMHVSASLYISVRYESLSRNCQSTTGILSDHLHKFMFMGELGNFSIILTPFPFTQTIVYFTLRVASHSWREVSYLWASFYVKQANLGSASYLWVPLNASSNLWGPYNVQHPFSAQTIRLWAPHYV